ncbi:MAG TPA: ion channel, partial [Bradyrhizobium sp.]|nr:ion channel [Bradyrhizobium sp.]
YFSVVTQLTIGYGDLTPTSYLRAIIAAQGVLGFLVGIFAVSRVIAFLPKPQSVIGD